MDRNRVPDGSNGRELLHASQPTEPRRVERNLRLRKQRRESSAVLEFPKHGAIPRCARLEIICEYESAGTRHVLDDDGRVSGAMPRQLPCEQAANGGIPSACR